MWLIASIFHFGAFPDPLSLRAAACFDPDSRDRASLFRGRFPRLQGKSVSGIGEQVPGAAQTVVASINLYKEL